MTFDKKEEEFKMKSLKLLADPCKLKDITYVPREVDKMKDILESKYNYKLSSIVYDKIKYDIKELLIIDSVINNIINQVSLDQNP